MKNTSIVEPVRIPRMLYGDWAHTNLSIEFTMETAAIPKKAQYAMCSEGFMIVVSLEKKYVII